MHESRVNRSAVQDIAVCAGVVRLSADFTDACKPAMHRTFVAYTPSAAKGIGVVTGTGGSGSHRLARHYCSRAAGRPSRPGSDVLVAVSVIGQLTACHTARTLDEWHGCDYPYAASPAGWR
jgi:hypothetical protein